MKIMFSETSELTSLEVKRFNEFKKKHPTAKAFFTTDFDLGVGYTIFASTLDLPNELELVSEENTKNITDIEFMLDNV
jgi:hypothetical protein